MTGTVTVAPVRGVGEVTAGTDLAAALLELADLADGDIVVITSKVVSKSEGRVVTSDREAALAAETDRVVARRGPTTVVRTRHGLVMAAAGIDASNTVPGTVVLLPADPDASARALREALARQGRVNVAVVVSDTSGRAWRNGQTDIAIGAAGLLVIDDLAGQVDPYGNPLAVTAPALADEIAGAGDLVKGKLSGCPAAVVRGLADLVLPPGRHGSGAAALVRAEEGDLFGYGTREAVLQALSTDGTRTHPGDGRGFGAPASADEVAAAVRRLRKTTATVVGETVEALLDARDERDLGALEARVEAVAVAHRWRVERHEVGGCVTLHPSDP